MSLNPNRIWTLCLTCFLLCYIVAVWIQSWVIQKVTRRHTNHHHHNPTAAPCIDNITYRRGLLCVLFTYECVYCYSQGWKIPVMTPTVMNDRPPLERPFQLSFFNLGTCSQSAGERAFQSLASGNLKRSQLKSCGRARRTQLTCSKDTTGVYRVNIWYGHLPWVSYQICKITGCAWTGNVFPAADFKGDR